MPPQQPGAFPPPKKSSNKTLFIVLGVLLGLCVLGSAGAFIGLVLVGNAAEDTLSDIESDLSDFEDTIPDFDEEADLATWCSEVDFFDEFAEDNSNATTPDEVEDKVDELESLMATIEDTVPSDLEDATARMLVPYEETIEAFRDVDFDVSQLSSSDQQALNNEFQQALPAMLEIQNACRPEGITVFEAN
jgi:hypothetical protein